MWIRIRFIDGVVCGNFTAAKIIDDDPGTAGVFAKLPKHPNSGGTRAEPPRDDSK